ncbi:MAG: acyltransferase family protein [Clostridia bacterium]|nr:acyltransferase family protein [Clostridia bacterium]
MIKNQLVPISLKKHNGIISFWKFCFCIMVVLFHSQLLATNEESTLFSQGAIAVEFFFLVSGFLLAKTTLRKNEQKMGTENLGKETFHFIWKKYLFFLPYMLFGGFLGLLLQNIYNDVGTYQNISSIWDILLLRMTGLNGNVVIGQAWYISAMLLSMMILYPLLRKYQQNFIYLVAPLIVLLGFGWLSRNYSNLRGPDIWINFTFKGVIRAFSELSLGCILYLICQKVKQINFTKFGRFVITIIEIIGFIFPFLIAQFASTSKYDFIIVPILAISILLAFSEKTLELNCFNHQFFFWLEKLSLPLYICHIVVRNFIMEFSPLSSLSYSSKVPIYLLLCFVLSLICMYFIKFLQKIHIIEYFKKFIIKNMNQITENN